MGPGYSACGAGETVLMLHGSLGSKSQWRALAERLAPRYRAVAVDLHGYGDNAMPRLRYRHRFAFEVALVMRRLGEAGAKGPMHVVGHSFGAGVALELAALHPGRVATLALYEPPCFPMLAEGDPDRRAARGVGEAISRRVREGRLDEAVREFLDYWGGAGSHEALPADVREALARRAPKAALDFDAVFAGGADWREVAAPTLVLRGERSPRAVRRAVEVLAGAMPNARLQELSGDHLMPVREPGPVNAAIGRFLDTWRWIEANRPRGHPPRPSPASCAATMA